MTTVDPMAIPVTLRRSLDIGLRIAPTVAAATPAAKALAARLDDISTPVRLAGISRDGTRIHLTLAITLGEIDDIKSGAPGPRAAVRSLQRLIEEMSAYDPALVLLPDRSSPEARLAAEITRRARTSGHAPWVSAVAHLVAVG